MNKELLGLAKRVYQDLVTHNLITSYHAGWVQSPEGIAEYFEMFINRGRKKTRSAHIEVERKPHSIVVRVVVSTRKAKVSEASE